MMVTYFVDERNGGVKVCCRMEFKGAQWRCCRSFVCINKLS